MDAMEPTVTGLTCVICMSIYDDPCFCSDGWSYCRLCVARWAQACPLYNHGKWKSPRSNMVLRLPAVLRSNEELGVIVLEEKKRRFAQKMETGSAKDIIHAAACLCEKGRPVCATETDKKTIFKSLNQIDWNGISSPEVSRLFAEALSVVHRWPSDNKNHDMLERLLECTGPSAARALIQRDLGAVMQPLLRLGVLTDLLKATANICERKNYSSLREWISLLRDMLNHYITRGAMMDSIKVSRRCFARHQAKCAGIYFRCDHQSDCRPGIERFVCSTNQAHLDIQLWPSAAFDLVDTNYTAVITPADGRSPAHFRSHVPFNYSQEAAWEMRRLSEKPVFPDYDPRWSEDLDMWSSWGDEDVLGIFERLPLGVPEGFEYQPSSSTIEPQSKTPVELCIQQVINVFYNAAMEGGSKRRRRH